MAVATVLRPVRSALLSSTRSRGPRKSAPSATTACSTAWSQHVQRPVRRRRFNLARSASYVHAPRRACSSSRSAVRRGPISMVPTPPSWGGWMPFTYSLTSRKPMASPATPDSQHGTWRSVRCGRPWGPWCSGCWGFSVYVYAAMRWGLTRPRAARQVRGRAMPDTFFTAAPHWRWLIVLYFFIGGMAGGSFALAALLDLFGKPQDRPLVRTGYYVARSEERRVGKECRLWCG